MSKLYTNIVPKHILRQKQLVTLERVAQCLESAYGPFASTTAIRRAGEKEEANGYTAYTKDGHTILKSIMIARPIEATTIQDVIDVTGETVKKVGDGTTSATILSYLIFSLMHAASVKYGVPETRLVSDLKETAEKVIAKIDEVKHEATDLDIFEIAMIATNGNVAISDSIRQIYIKHGMGVHIDIGISNTENHVLKEYDGLTFEQGYYNAAFINNEAKATSEIRDARVYVFEDSIDTVETRALMDKILADNIYNPIQQMAAIRQMSPEEQKQIEESGMIPQVIPTVIFSAGYGTDMRTSSDEIIDFFARFPIAQRPPILSVTNIHDGQARADLCTLTGAKPIKKYNSVATQKMDQENNLAPTLDTIHQFAGKAGLVVADATKTKVIDPDLMYQKDPTTGETVLDQDNNPVYSQVYNSLINTCEAQLKNMLEVKTDITDIYRMRKRINSLKGNMVEYLIGGVSMADRDSVRDLAEDAILNCRSAAQDGVGFGANFEAFRVLHGMLNEEERCLPEDVQAALKKGENVELGYSMTRILFNAYKELAVILYKSALGGNAQVAQYIALNSLLAGCPCNLRELTFDQAGNPILNEKVFDKRVLSSIKSDQVILNAISKIIGLTFATNQFLTQTPAQNVYEEELYNAPKDSRVKVED